MPLRLISYGLCYAGALLLLLAGLLYCYQQEEMPVTVDLPHREVVVDSIGKPQIVRFLVRNRSRQTVRVVGALDYC